MGKTLVIDSGNTTSKAYLFDDEEIVEAQRYARLTIEELSPMLESNDISGVIYCTVARYDAKLVESLRHSVSANVVAMTHDTLIPIKIDYSTPKTLGLDRVAAAVGAVGMFPDEPMMIVDAGTAMTIDVVDAGSVYRGGNISPGISLRFRSLHDFTEALPLLEIENVEVSSFGKDTPGAIRSGVVNGVVAEIVASYTSATKQYGCNRLLLTGGDARYLAELLPLDKNKIVVADDLVAHGLNRILRYNEDI